MTTRPFSVQVAEGTPTGGYVPVVVDPSGPVAWRAPIQVSASDTTRAFLSDKFASSPGAVPSVVDAAGDEKIEVRNQAAGYAQTWSYSTTTTQADPGSGNVRFNAAPPNTATAMYISNTNEFPIVSALGTEVLARLRPGTRLFFYQTGGASAAATFGKFLLVNITGDVIDNGSWYEIPIEVEASGAPPDNGQSLSVGIYQVSVPQGVDGGGNIQVAWWDADNHVWQVSQQTSSSKYQFPVKNTTNTGVIWSDRAFGITNTTDAASSPYDENYGLVSHYPDSAAAGNRFILVADGSTGGAWAAENTIVGGSTSSEVLTFQPTNSDAQVTATQNGVRAHAVITSGQITVNDMVCIVTQNTQNVRMGVYDSSGNLVGQTVYAPGQSGVVTLSATAPFVLNAGATYYLAHSTSSNGTGMVGKASVNGGNSAFPLNVHDPAGGFDPVNPMPASIGLSNLITTNIFIEARN